MRAYDGAEIPPPRQLVAFLNILLNFQTWLRHAGRVRERKIVLRSDRHGRLYFDLALPLPVQTQRFLCVVHDPFFLLSKLFVFCVRQRGAAVRHDDDARIPSELGKGVVERRLGRLVWL